MIARTKSKPQPAPKDRHRELEAEIERLRHQVRELSARLEDERVHRGMLERAVGYATARARALELADGDIDGQENLYVFDDEDESGAAFDAFFGVNDPHLDKVRGFLLD